MACAKISTRVGLMVNVVNCHLDCNSLLNTVDGGIIGIRKLTCKINFKTAVQSFRQQKYFLQNLFFNHQLIINNNAHYGSVYSEEFLHKM